MRKILFGAILLAIGVSAVYAVSITVRPMFGWGFGMGSVIGTDTEIDAAGTLVRMRTLHYSAGAGMKIGAGVDIGLTGNIAVGFDAGYSMGLSEVVYRYTVPVGPSTITRATSFIPLSATLKTMSQVAGLTLFAGAGPTLLLMPSSRDVSTNIFVGTGFTNRVAMEQETTYHMGVGFHGVAGVGVNVDDNLMVIAEVRLDQVFLRAARSRITTFTVNGVNQLPGMTISDREIEFRDEIRAGDLTGRTTADPSLALAYTTPAESLSIRVGVGIRF